MNGVKLVVVNSFEAFSGSEALPSYNHHTENSSLSISGKASGDFECLSAPTNSAHCVSSFKRANQEVEIMKFSVSLICADSCTDVIVRNIWEKLMLHYGEDRLSSPALIGEGAVSRLYVVEHDGTILGIKVLKPDAYPEQHHVSPLAADFEALGVFELPRCVGVVKDKRDVLIGIISSFDRVPSKSFVRLLTS